MPSCAQPSSSMAWFPARRSTGVCKSNSHGLSPPVKKTHPPCCSSAGCVYGKGVREARNVGNGKHLRLVVDGGPQTPVIDAVAFQQGEWCAQVPEGGLIDL